MAEASYIPDAVTDAVGQDAAPAADAQATPEMLSPKLLGSALRPTFKAIFNAAASARGDHWQLKEWESDALVTGWTPILQYMLAKLGNSEQVMMTLAIGSTVAIVGGKVAQDGMLQRSARENMRTRGSGESSSSSASATPENPPSPSPLYVMHDE